MSEPGWFDDGTPIPGGPDEVADDPDEELWSARSDLAFIRDYARAYRVSPLATLGVALARVVAHTPPDVVLPPLVGSSGGSLNLFVALVGRSGQGKGTSESTGMAALDMADPLTPAGVGSGEGLPHLFVHAAKVWEEYEGKDGQPHRRQVYEVKQHATAAILSIPEVDTLTALGGRAGSTLMPELRKAWVGEALGFQYASIEKRLPVGAHAYRLSLIVGVQPARAGTLLDDVDGGTPQRFLWLPTSDPYAPLEQPEGPEPMPWIPPQPDSCPVRRGQWEIPVCGEAMRLIDENRLHVLWGEVAALDTHVLFTRLKLAAALGILDRRCEVNEQDWALAGYLITVSARTRTAILRERVLKERAADKMLALREADRSIITDHVVTSHAVERVARRMYERLAVAKVMTHRDLQSAIAARDRKYFDDALYMLLDAGKISKEASKGGQTGPRGVAYRFGIQ